MHAFDGEAKYLLRFLFFVQLFSQVYFHGIGNKLILNHLMKERRYLMKRKVTAVIMIMLLVFTMATLTGCGRNDGIDDLSQTPNNADDNLTNDNNHNSGMGNGTQDDQNKGQNGGQGGSFDSDRMDDDQLDDDRLPDDRDNLMDDLRDDADDLGDDIRDGAEDVKDDVKDALDGDR